MNLDYSSSAILRSAAILGLVLLLLIVFLTTGIILQGSGSAELRANRAKWDQSERDAYSYKVRPYCFCSIERLAPYTVTVRSGVVSAEIEESWLSDYSGYQIGELDILTIEKLFELAETSRADADRVRVKFDDKRGFPTSISIDRNRDIIDDEYGVSVSDFRVLTSGD